MASESENVEVLTGGTTPPEVSIAASIIPYPFDDNRGRFLGYRACGVSVREALHFLKIGKSALSNWRTDPEFDGLERRLPEFRQSLAKQFIELEFYRNFRFVLEKDYQVLKDSINKDKTLSKADSDYLLRLRTQYTPQQLQMLEAVVKGSGDGWNFAKFVSENQEMFTNREMEISRTDSVKFK